jgi:hypothetical protein
MARRRNAKPDKPAQSRERASLAGLEPEEALRALLKVDPESEPTDSDQSAAADEALPSKRE